MGRKKTVEFLSVLFIVMVALFSSLAKAEENRLTFSSELSQSPGPSPDSMTPRLFTTEADYAASLGTYQSGIYGNTLYKEIRSSATEIYGSSSKNSGIISINQASGSLNNQENMRVVTLISKANSLSNMEMNTAAEISSNEMLASGSNDRKAIVEDSFHENAGIIGINQSPGNYNIQGNNLLVVVGGLVSLNNMELEEVMISDNEINQDESDDRLNLVKNSFSNTYGIVQVNQASGDMCILKNNLTLSMREIDLR